MPRNQPLPAFMVALVVLAPTAGCRPRAPAFVELEQARRAAADLRVHLNKAADASNRAVMADTDEASIAFAREAEALSKEVTGDIAALAPALQRLGFPDEIRLLSELEKHFAKYLQLDRSILELAVENTNLKAQRLSFGASREAADGFRAALESMVGSAAPKDRCRIQVLIDRAVLAVRDIQVLHAPHIAETDAAKMTDLEREIGGLTATAIDAVEGLTKLGGARHAEAVVVARRHFDQFKEISDQIVSLSRRNSNVRSFDLALRARPPLTAACDNTAKALQEALANEGSKATR
jgi:hypothetical protein